MRLLGDDFKPDWKGFFSDLLLVFLILMLLFVCLRHARAQSVPLVRAAHDSFVSYYDVEKHNPALVVFTLEAAHFAGNCKVGSRHFKMDTKLPRPRVKDADYSNTGYVRGHLIAAADRDSRRDWMKETFLTSNLVPMTMVTNSGPWKAIEDSCRALALAGHRLTVARGPLYYKAPGSGALVIQDIWRAAARVVQNRIGITIPDGFFCMAKCQDCNLRYCSMCYNSGTNTQGFCNTFTLDERISVLLQNILGLWSREEYETITR